MSVLSVTGQGVEYRTFATLESPIRNARVWRVSAKQHVYSSASLDISRTK